MVGPGYYMTRSTVISPVLLSNVDRTSAVDNPGHVMCICHVGLDLSCVTCMCAYILP